MSVLNLQQTGDMSIVYHTPHPKYAGIGFDDGWRKDVNERKAHWLLQALFCQQFKGEEYLKLFTNKNIKVVWL